MIDKVKENYADVLQIFQLEYGSCRICYVVKLGVVMTD